MCPLCTQASVEKRKGEAKAAEAAAVRAAAELEGAASEQEALAGKIKEATALCEGKVHTHTHIDTHTRL